MYPKKRGRFANVGTPALVPPETGVARLPAVSWGSVETASSGTSAGLRTVDSPQNLELKTVDVASRFNHFTTTGNAVLLRGPKPGVGDHNRIGNQIRVWRLQLRVIIEQRLLSLPEWPRGILRVTLVYDRQCRGQLSNLFPDIIESTGAEGDHELAGYEYCGWPNGNNRNRYLFLMDRFIPYPAGAIDGAPSANFNDQPLVVGNYGKKTFLIEETFDLDGILQNYSGNDSKIAYVEAGAFVLYLTAQTDDIWTGLVGSRILFSE